MIKNILILLGFFIFSSNFAFAKSIAEELTQLNNLYKEGAITEKEFSKAKSILLKTGISKEKDQTEKKEINYKVIFVDYKKQLNHTFIQKTTKPIQKILQFEGYFLNLEKQFNSNTNGKKSKVDKFCEILHFPNHSCSIGNNYD